MVYSRNRQLQAGKIWSSRIVDYEDLLVQYYILAFCQELPICLELQKNGSLDSFIALVRAVTLNSTHSKNSFLTALLAIWIKAGVVYKRLRSDVRWDSTLSSKPFKSSGRVRMKLRAVTSSVALIQENRTVVQKPTAEWQITVVLSYRIFYKRCI